ncbi:MAG: pyridoxamine 5'-phosphate oxidase family protein [Chloroflexi bacterium]|nr:pyridoxamine 5'-phosphate oxidase family protein [Chloroflexota bacterium]
MFREMRRANQLLPMELTEDVLRRATAGVLALEGENSYPYAVPLSYVYGNGKIYFHSATSGYKFDLIQANGMVSFCVIEQDQIVPEELTTYFRSVIVFGKAKVIRDEQEKRRALELLSEKYSPGYEEKSRLSIERNWDNVCIVGIEIDHVTGKEARELAKLRKSSSSSSKQ